MNRGAKSIKNLARKLCEKIETFIEFKDLDRAELSS